MGMVVHAFGQTCLCNKLSRPALNKHSCARSTLHGYSPRDMITVYFIVMDIDRFGSFSITFSFLLVITHWFFSGSLPWMASLISSRSCCRSETEAHQNTLSLWLTPSRKRRFQKKKLWHLCVCVSEGEIKKEEG